MSTWFQRRQTQKVKYGQGNWRDAAAVRPGALPVLNKLRGLSWPWKGWVSPAAIWTFGSWKSRAGLKIKIKPLPTWLCSRPTLNSWYKGGISPKQRRDEVVKRSRRGSSRCQVWGSERPRRKCFHYCVGSLRKYLSLGYVCVKIALRKIW